MKTMYCRTCEEEVEVADDQNETQIHKECGTSLSKISYIKEIFATVSLNDIFRDELPESWLPTKVELVKEKGNAAVKFTFKINWRQN